MVRREKREEREERENTSENESRTQTEPRRAPTIHPSIFPHPIMINQKEKGRVTNGKVSSQLQQNAGI